MARAFPGEIESMKARMPFVLATAALLAVGLLTKEWELPICDLLEEGDRVSASYWAPKTPHTRIALDCNDGAQTCVLSVYASYWLPYWFDARGETSIEVPQKYVGYEFVAHRIDLTGYERVR